MFKASHSCEWCLSIEKNSIVGFIPTDDVELFEKLEKQIKQFEPDLPLVQAKDPGIDPEYAKRAKSLWTQLLLREYDRVICISPEVTIKAPFVKDIPADADVYAMNYGAYQIPSGISMPVVWNIHSLKYAHLKFMVINSKRFAELWFKLCMSEHLDSYPRFELDLFNILLQYGDFDVKYPSKPIDWHSIDIP